MDVMVADVGGEPGHERTHRHKTGRFQGGFFISPAGIVPERDARKVMLSVKEITANGAGDKMGNEQGQEQGGDTQKENDRHSDEDVEDESDQTVIVFARIVYER